MRRFAVALTVLSFPFGLRADFSYTETSKITGGAMAGAMKFAGIFSKKLREPIQSTVAVKGNRMFHGSNDSAQVIDLDAETITQIDYTRKQYSVMTFAEMVEAMKAATEKMSQARQEAAAQQPTAGQPTAQMEYKISVKETGQTKEINGFSTKQVVMTLEAEMKDKKSGETGTMDMTADMWIAPKVKGHEEIDEFYKRMAQKIAFTPAGMQLAAAGAGQMQGGMVKIQGEVAKMNGIAIVNTIRMGVAGDGTSGGGGSAQPSSSASSQPAPSMKDALGGAVLGGFGRFGRRKPKEEPKKEEPKQEQTPPPQQQPQQGSASLMEMTVEMSGLTQAPVDASRFQVPSGFKMVESPMKKMSQQ
ncbi:MAG: hypothetical protein ACKV22_23170 [Bryobacteraceae bacterium]